MKLFFFSSIMETISHKRKVLKVLDGASNNHDFCDTSAMP